MDLGDPQKEIVIVPREDPVPRREEREPAPAPEPAQKPEPVPA